MITPDRLRELLAVAREAGVTKLRVGGAHGFEADLALGAGRALPPAVRLTAEEAEQERIREQLQAIGLPALPLPDEGADA